MNDLCADIGYKSINHDGELLCGDHVEIVEGPKDSTVVVLADGLGSGVKASILSTLTARIISTMLAEGMKLEDCVETIAATLPIDAQKEVAYSTFTIINIVENRLAEIIQYDNPDVILLREGKRYSYPKKELLVGDKKIYKSELRLHEDDMFIMMSDGCPHAGIGNNYNFGWKPENIAEYMEGLAGVGYTAKTLATFLVDECFKLYGGHPRDDVTSCVIRIRKRETINLLFGPPQHVDDNERMMSLFFSKAGKHVVCGGTTAKVAAGYLGKQVLPGLRSDAPDIPPISLIEGVDLTTEGVITVNKVLTYAKDYLDENKLYSEWGYRHDGASLIARLLFEDATDINFFIGKAVNPAHQDPALPLNFHIKMNLAEGLRECLTKMGKRVKVSYF